MFYATDESRTSISETNNILFINSLNLNTMKKKKDKKTGLQTPRRGLRWLPAASLSGHSHVSRQVAPIPGGLDRAWGGPNVLR